VGSSKQGICRSWNCKFQDCGFIPPAPAQTGGFFVDIGKSRILLRLANRFSGDNMLSEGQEHSGNHEIAKRVAE
jgi:hypothetical protein